MDPAVENISSIVLIIKFNINTDGYLYIAFDYVLIMGCDNGWDHPALHV